MKEWNPLALWWSFNACIFWVFAGYEPEIPYGSPDLEEFYAKHKWHFLTCLSSSEWREEKMEFEIVPFNRSKTTPPRNFFDFLLHSRHFSTAASAYSRDKNILINVLFSKKSNQSDILDCVMQGLWDPLQS